MVTDRLHTIRMCEPGAANAVFTKGAVNAVFTKDAANTVFARVHLLILLIRPHRLGENLPRLKFLIQLPQSRPLHRNVPLMPLMAEFDGVYDEVSGDGFGDGGGDHLDGGGGVEEVGFGLEAHYIGEGFEDVVH